MRAGTIKGPGSPHTPTWWVKVCGEKNWNAYASDSRVRLLNEQPTLFHGHAAQGTAIRSSARGFVLRVTVTINRQGPRIAITPHSALAISIVAGHRSFRRLLRLSGENTPNEQKHAHGGQAK